MLSLYTVALTVGWATQVSAQCSATPTAVDDTARVLPEALVLDVLANDSDPSGSALSVTVTDHNCDAAVSVDEFGLVAVDTRPTTGKVCSLTYIVVNEEGGSDFATATLEFITDIFASGFEPGNTSEWSATAAQ